MRIKPQVSSVIGMTSVNNWSQVLLTPQAYGLLEIFDPKGEARQIGIETLANLSELLASGQVVSLADLTAKLGSISTQNLRTLIVLVPVGKVIYLVLRGAGLVYLKRNNKISVLLNQVGGISGETLPGDTFILASAGFCAAIDQAELTTVFDHLSAMDVAEKLTLNLHTKPQSEGAAAFIFQVEKLIPVEEETSERKELWVKKTAMLVPIWRSVRKAIPLGVRYRLRPYRTRWNLFWEGKNKIQFIVVLLLGLLFCLSVILGLQKQRQTNRNKEIEQVMLEARHDYDEGIALLTLNPLKSRERLQKAKSLLDTLKNKISSRTTQGRQIATFLREVENNLTELANVQKQDLQLFYDANLIKKDAQITQISLNGETLAMWDQINKSIYTLNLSSKKAEIVAGGEVFTDVSLLTIYGDKIYALTPRGIHEVRLNDKKTTADLITKDTNWQQIKSLVAYAGNLYLLDTGNSRIWKYVATENDLPAGRQGFSTLKEYLNPDTLVDLNQANNLMIDGHVWIATANGKILRFSQGKENTFMMQGIEPALQQNLLIYVTDQTKNLYLLDQTNKRIVVLDKDGMYLSAYIWTNNLSPTQFIVSESAKKIILVADGKLYQLNLE